MSRPSVSAHHAWGCVLLTLPVLATGAETAPLDVRTPPAVVEISSDAPVGIPAAATPEFNAPQPSVGPNDAPFVDGSTTSLPAVEVDSRRTLTIAYLLPPDDSAFLSASQTVANGLVAASKTSARPATILTVAAGSGGSVDEQIDAAVMSGADVVVGPLQRDLVDALATRTSLPIPVVALNAVPEKSTTAPQNLIMMSMSTENEADYVARLAVRALPESTERGSAPKIALLTTNGAWETRIRAAYERVLREQLVDYEVFVVSTEELPELQKQLEPALPPEDEAEFRQRIAALRAEKPADAAASRRQKSRIRAVESERRAKVATAEPPFASALLAMDAQTAGLVRNRLPQRMRIWATSVTNPGDPRTSSSATALAYDLDNLAFTECPLLVRYDAQGFEARFATAMPYSLSAKRLFALGVDAYEMARQWASHRHNIQYYGETGALTLNRDVSAVVARVPRTVVVKSGMLVEVPAKELAVPGDMPKIALPEPPVPPTPLPEAGTTVETPSRPSVTSILIRPEDVPADLPPSPPVARPVAPAPVSGSSTAPVFDRAETLPMPSDPVEVLAPETTGVEVPPASPATAPEIGPEIGPEVGAESHSEAGTESGTEAAPEIDATPISY